MNISKTNKKINYINTVLDKTHNMDLIKYIYTQRKSVYTEQELYDKLPSKMDNIDKDLIIANLCQCNLLTKHNRSEYKRLTFTDKFKKQLKSTKMNEELRSYFIFAIENKHV